MNSEVIPVFGYEYDAETGGLLLNDSTPNSSKEPRPVYAAEMRMLHMDEWFTFTDQDDSPTCGLRQPVTIIVASWSPGQRAVLFAKHL